MSHHFFRYFKYSKNSNKFENFDIIFVFLELFFVIFGYKYIFGPVIPICSIRFIPF